MSDNAIALVRQQQGLFADADQPLGLDEYQRFTARTDRNERSGIDGLGFVFLGLFGEIGSLLSALKKKQRDKEAFVAYHDEVIEELGDALWYFSNAARRADLPLEQIVRSVPLSLADWDYAGKSGATTFVDLQQHEAPFEGPISGDIVERRLLALAGRVGVLLSDWAAGEIRENRDRLSADLVEIFRALLMAADDAQVSLDLAARKNVVKTLGRWPDKETWGPLFDEAFPDYEQLPRVMEVEFIERTVGGREFVVMRYNGVNLGSPLTDNRHEPDDYRYHDVFHLAFAGILGWSPTLRALLKIKRKSQPDIDENEDGARANIIEEGISTWIFNHGLRHSEFRNVGSLDYGLLKAVHELVRGYEVERRPLWQWERAILEGFRVFRELREHRHGTVKIDLNRRSIEFRESHG
ncbi:nucleoside triphosphate pyrophosphohydrolase family protein [Mesorhizobium sp. Z1-4]|uniref:nucleoside triphosphate pyrophosphohydrolase family protein n=1 Tax=Mesorhizobium sp. Z1-4 TaxID=2448478 RepID=UPI000FDC427F|nr:nucleoside triphosphate pyrophosphohydrolase family protein [Mesorhizobium sp. Z1-4]